MSDLDDTLRKIEELGAESSRKLEELKRWRKDPAYRRITVNKLTHRIRFEDETEEEVIVVVERRGGDA